MSKKKLRTQQSLRVINVSLLQDPMAQRKAKVINTLLDSSKSATNLSSKRFDFSEALQESKQSSLSQKTSSKIESVGFQELLTRVSQIKKKII